MGMVVGLGRGAGAERLIPLGFLNKRKSCNIFLGIGVIWTMQGRCSPDSNDQLTMDGRPTSDEKADHIAYDCLSFRSW